MIWFPQEDHNTPIHSAVKTEKKRNSRKKYFKNVDFSICCCAMCFLYLHYFFPYFEHCSRSSRYVKGNQSSIRCDSDLFVACPVTKVRLATKAYCVYLLFISYISTEYMKKVYSSKKRKPDIIGKCINLSNQRLE